MFPSWFGFKSGVEHGRNYIKEPLVSRRTKTKKVVMNDSNNPDPPWRVYGIQPNSPFDSFAKHPRWYQFYNKEWLEPASGSRSYGTCHCSQLTPIYDPRNDPEAVEIIRKAKEAT
jgi:hypothetical protein